MANICVGHSKEVERSLFTITYRQAVPLYNEAHGRNLKAYESNGLKCISVNYVLVSAAKELGRQKKMGLLYHRDI